MKFRSERFSRHVAVAASLVISITIGVGTRSAGAQKSILENFTSPSGNIHCLMVFDENGTSADCSVLKPSWARLASKPKDCDLDWDPAEIILSVEGSQATIQEGGCRGDIGPYCPGDCRKLAYGSSVKLGKIACTSLQQGIRCQATIGKRKGFLVAARSWKRF
jgi:hypothetical protein